MAERWIADNDPSQRYPIYTRGNVGEVFPDPVAPFSWTLWGTRHAEPGWREAFKRFGAFDLEEFADGAMEVIGVFGGYCYLNVSISRIFGVRVPGLSPEAIDQSLFGGGTSEVPPFQAQPGDDSANHSERSGATLRWVMSTSEHRQPNVDATTVDEVRKTRPDLAGLTDRALLERTRSLIDSHWRPLWVEHLFTTYCSLVAPGVLGAVAAELGDPSLITRLVVALGAVESAKPAQALWTLSRMVRANLELSSQFDRLDAGLLDRIRARPDSAVSGFVSAFEDFLYRYGARGVNEWEMRSQTFETNPEIALAALDRLRRADDEHDPAIAHRTLAAERDELVAQIGEKLEAMPELKGQFLGAVQSAKVFLAARELTKSNTIRITHEGRMAMRELGQRMVDRGLFDRVETFGMLTNDEWDAFLADPVGSGLAEVARERERRYAELCRLEPPFIVNGEVAPVETWRRRTDGIEPAGVGTTLQGIPGCPGIARGRAKIVHDPGDPAALETGDILVAPATDSSWTPLFIPSAGVVVNVGALVSHAVVISRELGIPCAVSVSDATRRIPDDAIIEVDGSKGTVTVLEV